MPLNQKTGLIRVVIMEILSRGPCLERRVFVYIILRLDQNFLYKVLGNVSSLALHFPAC